MVRMVNRVRVVVTVGIVTTLLLLLSIHQAQPVGFPVGEMDEGDQCPFHGITVTRDWRILGIPAKVLGPHLSDPVWLTPEEQCRMQLFYEALGWATLMAFWVQPSVDANFASYRPRFSCSVGRHITLPLPWGDGTVVEGCGTEDSLWVTEGGVSVGVEVSLVTVRPQPSPVEPPYTEGGVPYEFVLDERAVLSFVRGDMSR